MEFGSFHSFQWGSEVIHSYLIAKENIMSDYSKGVLAIRRIFSLVDMITKPKFSNFPNVFKIGLFR